MTVQTTTIFHPGFSWPRVFAMVRRYWYLLRSSWPRVLDLIYWPTVQMCMWGLLQTYIGQQSGALARAGQTFIGAVMLWDILFRGQLGFSISFLEEMYSRNLSNLLISPLRPAEFLASLMLMSIVRLAIGMVPVTLLAIAFFGFNLWGLGFALAAFFFNLLLTSWAIGVFVVRAVAAQRLGRREHGVVGHVPVSAADLRLLPGRDFAGLAANRGLDVTADLCFRRSARIVDRPHVSCGPDDSGLRDQRRCCSGSQFCRFSRFCEVPGRPEPFLPAVSENKPLCQRWTVTKRRELPRILMSCGVVGQKR